MVLLHLRTPAYDPRFRHCRYFRVAPLLCCMLPVVGQVAGNVPLGVCYGHGHPVVDGAELTKDQVGGGVPIDGAWAEQRTHCCSCKTRLSHVTGSSRPKSGLQWEAWSPVHAGHG